MAQMAAEGIAVMALDVRNRALLGAIGVDPGEQAVAKIFD